ncbi:MAG: hypothetical protein AAGU11_04005 [Syntrophobacteraceae bacterium]
MTQLKDANNAPDSAKPECFGDGEKVCPQDETGVMQPRVDCIPCPHLRACLQLVLHRRGKIRLVEELPSTKVTGFLKRWSDQKLSKK